MNQSSQAPKAPGIDNLYDATMFLAKEYREGLISYFNDSSGTPDWKLQNFAKFVPRQALARFLCRYEMFTRIRDVPGSVFECGVFGGGGLMIWAQLSAILEPLNIYRKIVGFDTFTGFAEMAPEDRTSAAPVAYQGGLAMDSYDDILQAVKLYDMNRFMGASEKVRLVKGDIRKTVPEYLEKYPETVVSLVYLDVDVYEPTKVAIEHFLPRMPKGAILAFDELNDRGWPGETLAVLHSVGIRNLRLQRFNFDTKISYAVLE